MLRNAGLAIVAFVAAATPVAAFAAQDMIGELFDKAVEIYTEKGYTATGWERRGALAQGKEERFKVALNGAEEYQIIGVCDGDCENLDIHVYDNGGKLVDQDEEEDDFPIVGVARSGSFTIAVSMAKCAGTCNYGVKTFQK